MNGANWSISLVIPAYNEEAGIVQALAEARRDLPLVAGTFEILVVDDGSRDATVDLVEAQAHKWANVRLLRHEKNRGYGAALRTGFEAARHDLIAFTDADCQFELADLASLLPLTERAPIVVGYRLNRQDALKRRFFSWGYNHLIRRLLGTRVRDVDCALKVFRREGLQQILPESRGFFVNTEMLTHARLLGLEIAEVGVRHRPRTRGESKVSLADIPRTLRTLLPFWWSNVVGKRRLAQPVGPVSYRPAAE